MPRYIVLKLIGSYVISLILEIHGYHNKIQEKPSSNHVQDLIARQGDSTVYIQEKKKNRNGKFHGM